MKKIINKPYLFFFGLAPILVIIAFLSGDKAIDINIQATYLVMSYYHFWLFSAVFFTMIGLNYFSLNWAQKPPKKWLSIIHIYLQSVALILFITSNNWNWIGAKPHPGLPLIVDNSNFVILISFLIFLLATFVHLVNFFTSLFIKAE